MSRAALRRRLARVSVAFRRRAALAVCVLGLGVGAASCAGQAGAGNGPVYGPEPEPAPGTVAATARDAAAESAARTTAETAGFGAGTSGAATTAGPEATATPPGPAVNGSLRVFDDGREATAQLSNPDGSFRATTRAPGGAVAPVALGFTGAREHGFDRLDVRLDQADNRAMLVYGAPGAGRPTRSLAGTDTAAVYLSSRDVNGEVFGERDCAVDLEFRDPAGAAIPSAGTVHRQTCNGWVTAPLPEQTGPAQLRVTVAMSGFEPLVIAQPIVLAGNA